MKRSAALLGGDRRQVYLARLLLEDSWKVVTWGLEKGDAPNGVPLHSALEAPSRPGRISLRGPSFWT